MSEPLAPLQDAISRMDYNSKLGAYREATEDLEELEEEVKASLNGKGSLSEDEKEQVRTAYQDVVRTDMEHLRSGSFEIDEFLESVRNVQGQLSDLLRNPQAESVVDQIDNWLLSTGLDPLSKDERNSLREVIISELELCREEVKDAIKSHDNLRGHLGEPQESVDELLRQDIADVSSAGDLSDLRDALETLDTTWPGNWVLDHSIEAGTELNQRIWSILVDELKDDIKSKSTLTQVAVLVDSRHERIERVLDDIDDRWQEIEIEATPLIERGFIEQTLVMMLVEDACGSDGSLSTYRAGLQKASDAIEALRSIATTSLADLEIGDRDVPSEVSDTVQEIRVALDKVDSARTAAQTASEIETITQSKETFDTAIQQARESRSDLASAISKEIQMTRTLAGKFELDQEADLGVLLSEANSADEVSELLEIYDRYEPISEAIREEIRSMLSASQEALFSQLLALDGDASAVEFTQLIDENQGDATEELLSDLNALRERDLIEIQLHVN